MYDYRTSDGEMKSHIHHHVMTAQFTVNLQVYYYVYVVMVAVTEVPSVSRNRSRVMSGRSAVLDMPRSRADLTAVLESAGYVYSVCI